MEKPLLDPREREIYLDHLRPPQGYRLDGAIATTFSLDLMSLLIAPVAMALQAQRIDRKTALDPLVVVEAIQQAAGRFAVFCQKGRIAIPRHDTLLYSYLEKSVIEVHPLDPDGVFHPKTWLLRYTGKDIAPVQYRFLCLSKNLTFDNSWDTVLSLEGTLAEHRSTGYGLNKPLADFHQSLPRLAAGSVRIRVRDLVSRMAEEVKRVLFEPPEGFESIEKFIPVGIEGHKRFPRLPDHKRSLVLSPFLSPGGIDRITKSGREHIVISRSDSLDGLSDQIFGKLNSTTSFYFLDEAAERPEEEDPEESQDGTHQGSSEDFSGLHAKLILTENGAQATVYTGSANATGAALTGRNVEFMVALGGLRRRAGIDRFLGDEDAVFSFRNMLRPYIRSQNGAKVSTEYERLEKALELGRRALSGANLGVHIAGNDQGLYSLKMVSTDKGVELPESVRGMCFPITLSENHALDLAPLARCQGVEFQDLTAVALTSFMGFFLEVKGAGETARIAFVLNLPVQGMPAGRGKGILRSILSDRESFIRYLLLILGNEDGLGSCAAWRKGESASQWQLRNILPLFEEMVRAYSREPEKIQRIGQLVSDLREAGNLGEILPPGFEEVWSAFSNKTGRGVES
ncbi:MAG: phospholipase D family protein [Deltaproteobacteria bacterium]|nr:phospholipase D family protein [Deltaproteobacteria bacterium]